MDNIYTGSKLTGNKYKSITKQFFISFAAASFVFFATLEVAQGATYGPIKPGQTLWSIAYENRLQGVSRLQMMQALHKLNPQAFERNNINRLIKGSVLEVPDTKDMALELLSGRHVEYVREDSNKSATGRNNDIKLLRAELTKVKTELAQSKETLKGLSNQSAQLKNTTSPGIQKKLLNVTEDFKAAQFRIKKLEAEKATLLKASKNSRTGDQDSTLEALAAVTEELAESQLLTKRLSEKNEQLKIASINPALLKDTQKKLATTHEQLEALKVQNQLLREQTANADVSVTERNESNRKFSNTIAALNSDIGQLRTRIVELEELEKIKDNHIAELQKSLTHATTVIKEQAEVNKKMYARLNKLEEADTQGAGIVAAKTTPPVTATTVAATTSPDKSSSSVVSFANKAESNRNANITNTLEQVSPKFLLMITLAGLLLVLALLWRVVSRKDEADIVI